ncbi:unnamed protein product [Clavelina lepadiformis]|uniref:BTB domain-containing protein n=1 Tax=Clavelina lepadiformis TaxID=159417 RepID=A0ABP0GFV4_CLALP
MLSRKKVIKKGRSSNILNKINSQRLNKKFCDVVLFVDEEEFPTHRAVLAASSEYFDAMFSSKASIKQKNRCIVFPRLVIII